MQIYMLQREGTHKPVRGPRSQMHSKRQYRGRARTAFQAQGLKTEALFLFFLWRNLGCGQSFRKHEHWQSLIPPFLLQNCRDSFLGNPFKCTRLTATDSRSTIFVDSWAGNSTKFPRSPALWGSAGTSIVSKTRKQPPPPTPSHCSPTTSPCRCPGKAERSEGHRLSSVKATDGEYDRVSGKRKRLQGWVTSWGKHSGGSDPRGFLPPSALPPTVSVVKISHQQPVKIWAQQLHSARRSAPKLRTGWQAPRKRLKRQHPCLSDRARPTISREGASLQVTDLG